MAKNWIQKAVNKKHIGFCSPMTKSTCTPKRKALAMTFKKHHGFHENGEEIQYDWGGALSGASAGASAGAAAGPWGAAIGAVVGGVAGSIMGGKKKQAEEEARKKRELEIKAAGERLSASNKEMNLLGDQTELSNMRLSNKTNLYMAKGGRMNRYDIGGKPKIPIDIKKVESDPYYKTTKESAISDKRTNDIAELNYYGNILNSKLKEKNPKEYEDLTNAWGFKENNPTSQELNVKGADQFIKDKKFNNSLSQNEVSSILKDKVKRYNELRGLYGKELGLYGENEDKNKPETWAIGARHAVAFNPARFKYEGRNSVIDPNNKLGARDIQYTKIYDPSSPDKYKVDLDEYNILSPSKANGGTINTPSKNTRRVDSRTTLMTNNQGGTSGTHETGYNIPMAKGGKQIGTIEPGELITTTPQGGDVVLTKRYGPNGENDTSFADRYLELNEEEKTATPSKREEIEKQKKILPKQNAAIADKLNLKGRMNRMGGKMKYGNGSGTISTNYNPIKTGYGKLDMSSSSSPMASTKGGGNLLSGLNSANLQTGLGLLTTLGTGIATDNTLTSQMGDIEEMQKLSSQHQISPIKFLPGQTTIDVSDQVGSTEREYLDSIQGVSTNVSDPSERTALRTSANINRMANLNNIYSGKQRTEVGLMNQNIDALNRNRTINTQMQNEESARKLGIDMQAINALSGIKSKRLENLQGVLGELGSIRKDTLSMDSLKQGYRGTIGDSFIGQKKFGGKIKSKSTIKSKSKSRIYA